LTAITIQQSLGFSLQKQTQFQRTFKSNLNAIRDTNTNKVTSRLLASSSQLQSNDNNQIQNFFDQLLNSLGLGDKKGSKVANILQPKSSMKDTRATRKIPKAKVILIGTVRVSVSVSIMVDPSPNNPNSISYSKS
jgi:RNAse (barnase) inhibitor barstar